MKIQPLYQDSPNSLVTGQILAQPDGTGFDLEATLQIVHRDSVVLIDFSAFPWLNEERSNLDEEVARLEKEREAVNTLADYVERFRQQFNAAADAAVAYLEG